MVFGLVRLYLRVIFQVQTRTLLIIQEVNTVVRLFLTYPMFQKVKSLALGTLCTATQQMVRAFLGVVCLVGQDENGRNIYDVHPCKKSQFEEIYTHGYFWVDDLTQRPRNKIFEEVSNSLARRGYPVDKSRFRFLYQFDLMEKAYPNTFRYLSAEESYYYWKSLGN